MDSEITDPHPRLRMHPLRWIGLLVLALLVAGGLCALLVIVSHNHSSQTEVNEQVAALRGKSQPVTFAELDPRLQGKSFEQGERLLKALAQVPRLPWQFDLITGEMLARPRTLPKGVEALESELALNRALRTEIVALVREAPIYFPYDYATNSPLDLPIAQCLTVRDPHRQLGYDFVICVARGDQVRASELVLDRWDLAGALENEPIPTAQIMRAAMLCDAIHDCTHLLSRFDVGEPWRQQFDQRLAHCESTLRMRPVVVAEAASTFTTIETMKQNGVFWRMSLVDRMRFGTRVEFLKTILGTDLAQGQVEILASTQKIIDLVDEPGSTAASQLVADDARLLSGNSELRLPGAFRSTMKGLRDIALIARQAATNCRIALRVDRYFRAQGHFPERLDNVLDESLTEIPVGLFSRKPLEYQHDDDSFEIIDVGDDTRYGQSSRLKVSYDWESAANSAPQADEDPERDSASNDTTNDGT